MFVTVINRQTATLNNSFVTIYLPLLDFSKLCFFPEICFGFFRPCLDWSSWWFSRDGWSWRSRNWQRFLCFSSSAVAGVVVHDGWRRKGYVSRWFLFLLFGFRCRFLAGRFFRILCNIYYKISFNTFKSKFKGLNL